MTKKKFKAAVVGCSGIGAAAVIYNKAVRPGTHAESYEKNKKTDLVALVDIDKDKLAEVGKRFPKARMYTDIGDMMAAEKPDIVSIATPTKMHCKNVLEVTKYKVPVILCEKPIAYSAADAGKMIAACKKNNVRLFINHQRHFDRLLGKWSDKVNGGFLGQVYQGNAYYYNGLYNFGTHLIDLMRMFLGEPTSVIGMYNKSTFDSASDPNIDGLIIFPHDLKMTLQSVSKNYGLFGLRIYGEKGMLNITNLGFQIEYRKKIDDENFKGFFKLSPETVTEGKARSLIAESIEYMALFLGKKAKPISTGEDGLAVLKILEALKESADKKGKEIKLK